MERKNISWKNEIDTLKTMAQYQTCRQIADKYGVSSNQIRCVLNYHGIKPKLEKEPQPITSTLATPRTICNASQTEIYNPSKHNR